MPRNIDESENTEIRDTHAPQPESAKLNLAYDLVFALVEDVYAKYGRTSHELVGIAFEGDKLAKVHVLFVSEDNVPNVPDMVGGMLLDWDVVAHVAEAWTAPTDDFLPPHEHPERLDVIAITLHTESTAFTALCDVDPVACTVTRGAFRSVNMDRRFVRELPTLN